ncbi:hypothetical protein CXB51_008327 [Gossypium anomalum]|uniref:Myb/SANT-like domain-containing protein n=1 Tax=Gossypium anomalum TaxID=47600 RepID=A0A8J5ZD52_9ROSI|nr:hypothetical protein CXB51_008327 [Gossypium anomalum]
MGSRRKCCVVACIVNLYNVGTYNADTGSKADYLNELERMLENILPHVMFKAKPNLESRIKTLKMDWTIVYDMLSGKDNSNFGWDEHRQMVVAEDAVWELYKYRATGKDAQTAADIVEEINAEDVATANNLKERNNYRGCKDDVSLDEMDVSATQLQSSKPNQGGSTSSKKKKKMDDGIEQISTSITDATMLLGENIRIVGL